MRVLLILAELNFQRCQIDCDVIETFLQVTKCTMTSRQLPSAEVTNWVV